MANVKHTRQQKQNQAPNLALLTKSVVVDKTPGMFKKVGKPRKNNQAPIEDIFKNLQNLKFQERDLITEYESIIKNLLEKNNKLLQQRRLLTVQNEELYKRIQQLEYQNQIYKTQSKFNVQETTIWTILDSQLPSIIQQVINQQYILDLGNNYFKCKIDTHTNIRAFYLSMLQSEQGRNQIQGLVEQLIIDQTYKILPLLSTNQFWGQLIINFLAILKDSTDIEQIYNYLNGCQLIDLLLISSLRSRVEFLAQKYSDQVETIQLFTALSNSFNLKMRKEQAICYQKYSFTSELDQFHVIINDVNEFFVEFKQIKQLIQSVQQSKLYLDQSQCEESGSVIQSFDGQASKSEEAF